ncbi:sulfurtransferase [Paenibacillus radicis (ex Xue et al. 2023)]|uniref:Sulfurtransferase n=1 Tax=Paenibacillus radicis (ex Xue et al. 2023) TaxID=2972489 RepID=A0ABT1YSN2_9BACL|nr:sulfurtransferase [Paenibacillus radicis (ex Xue et al. 2023)]MCR8636203.1 sulfurtransferase [Paenibacillus radicis (ex Xue et al. 2023)]
MQHIVSQDWLFDHGTDEHVVIADCRFLLGNPSAGREAYAVDHIPGAVYFDLEQDLSAPKDVHGGRHPLPDWNELVLKIGEAGINNEKTVIVYDDQGGAMASRLWWILHYLGLSQVYVLDGGYTKWKEAGYPVTDEPAIEHPTVFEPKPQDGILVSMEDVKSRIGRPGTVLIDSREERRYLGLEEAIDPVAGHIPGAKQYFWKDGLDEQGNWKEAESQKVRFTDLQSADEIIVYCGSGVTACPNVLALHAAGYTNVKLYSGSWSDWVSYSDNPVATGRE